MAFLPTYEALSSDDARKALLAQWIDTRPQELFQELARYRTLRVVAVATQVAPGDAPAQGQDCGKHHRQKLPLWLTDR